jgi:uncharacterized metal-binding protein
MRLSIQEGGCTKMPPFWGRVPGGPDFNTPLSGALLFACASLLAGAASLVGLSAGRRGLSGVLGVLGLGAGVTAFVKSARRSEHLCSLVVVLVNGAATAMAFVRTIPL